MCRRPCCSSCASASARASGSAARAPVLRRDRRMAVRQVAQQRRRCAATAGPAARRARPAAHRSARTGRGRSRRGSGARAAAPGRPGWRCTGAAACAPRRRASSAPSSSSARCSAPSATAMRASVRKPSSTASGRPLRSSTSSRLASSAAASSGWSRSHSAAASSAASMQAKGLRRPEVGLGAGQRRPQQVLGQQHLAFPQVGQSDDEVAPAADVAERCRRGRRAAPAAGAGAPAPARLRAACGRPSGWHAPAAAADRRSGGSSAQGSCSSAKRSGSSAKTAAPPRISAHSQRSASSTPGCARMRSTKRLGLLVALAERQRPGGGQQQARPAVELVGGQPRQPVEHGALAAARHQRFVQAALGELVGRFALARGERMARGRLEQAVRGQPLGGARMQRGLLLGRQQRRSAGATRRAPAHACAASRCPRRRRRSACRAPVAPAARPRRRCATAPQSSGCRWSRIGDARQEGDVGRVEVGQQQVDEAGRAARRRCAAIAATSACGSLPRGHHRQRELQAQRPAFGQLVQARRRVAVDPRAEARARQLDRLVELEAQQRRPDDGAAAVGDEVVDVELAVGARRHDGAQVGRRIAQQVGQRLARGGGRRSASSTISTMSSADLRHLGQPDRDAFQARPGRRRRAACGRRSGGPAPVRTASARPCTKRARVVVRPAPTARRRRAVRQVLAPPLRQQRGLAEAGRRLHQDDRTVAQAPRRRLQARPRDWWRGTRGGVTLSSRSSDAKSAVRSGESRHGAGLGCGNGTAGGGVTACAPADRCPW